MNRRRAITILAGAAALPGFGAQASTNLTTWRGIALGAGAQIVLDHVDAERLIARAVDEVHRLEKLFSLYREDSQLSRLNRDGLLPEPAFEMVELLSICAGLHARTGGAFDPTVQSLWGLYAQEYAAGGRPDEARIEQMLRVTGWQHVRFSGQQISFDRKGVQLTLNGVAQGYIADKVIAIFHRAGVKNVLVNTGEVSALGHGQGRDGWQVKIGSAEGRSVALHDACVATSAPLGTTFDSLDNVGHILDPRTGRSGGKWAQVSVISKSAAQADGLSTAFCLMDEAEITAAKGGETVLLA
ncbi:MAG: FAD:protein FMN transferase [Rhodobacteraceae bacterium]|nr:FAD:protein FMN transferase [Paracoccaceae bacterium]